MDFDTLQTGDILLYHGQHYWFSTLVEWVTGSNYSHVSIVVKDPNFTNPPLKGLYILESGTENIPDVEDNKYKFGVQLVPLKQVVDNYDGVIYYRKLVCVRDDKFYKLLSEAHTEVHNIKYDTDVVDMIKSLTNYGCVQKKNEFWCSALVSYIYTKLGFLPESTPWTIIQPEQYSSSSPSKLQFINCTLEDEVVIHQ